MMKVFYQDYYSDEGIEADDARQADLAFVLDLFYELTDEEDNFLGILSETGQILQFMFIEQDKWLTEVPSPNHVNYQMYADYDSCVKLINASFLLGEIVIDPEMKKVDIMKESLDDILLK